MKIAAVLTSTHALKLKRPYTIAFRSVEAVEISVVRLRAENGRTGFGAASPEPFVTGESTEDCRAALGAEHLQWLVGRDLRTLPALCRELAGKMARTPAARAAVDIALHDLLARHLEIPLVDYLGRAHQALPTSVTIGILPVEKTLEEAREHLGAGFRVLKIKLGHSLEEDLSRLREVRGQLGRDFAIRVDPNQGYSPDEVRRFAEETRDLDLEFLEQPMKADLVDEMRGLPEEVREAVAADESLLTPEDAVRLAATPRACGIFNIKLMKCGGIREALRIAAVAEASGTRLMWGCMDESAISIAGALHAAFASPATRYLDLDGSFDLARDVARGGFLLEDGVMRTVPAPGLGVEWLGD